GGRLRSGRGGAWDRSWLHDGAERQPRRNRGADRTGDAEAGSTWTALPGQRDGGRGAVSTDRRAHPVSAPAGGTVPGAWRQATIRSMEESSLSKLLVERRGPEALRPLNRAAGPTTGEPGRAVTLSRVPSAHAA